MHSCTQLTILLLPGGACSLSRQLLCSIHCGKPAVCCFSLAIASVWGSLPGCPRACGWGMVNTCGSEGLPLPGDCTHNIALLSTLALASQGGQNIRILQHVKQLLPLQISIVSSAKFTWNSSEQRTSRKMELEMPSQTPILTVLMEI